MEKPRQPSDAEIPPFEEAAVEGQPAVDAAEPAATPAPEGEGSASHTPTHQDIALANRNSDFVRDSDGNLVRIHPGKWG